MNTETIDKPITVNLNETPIYLSLQWWEKRRIWFNLLVGLAGLLPMLGNLAILNAFDVIGIIIYGIMMNLFYSCGFLSEAFNIYYLKNGSFINGVRYILLVIGIIATVWVTYFISALYFYFNSF